MQIINERLARTEKSNSNVLANTDEKELCLCVYVSKLSITVNAVNIRLLYCGANSTRDFPLNKIHVTNACSVLGFLAALFVVVARLLIDQMKSSQSEGRITQPSHFRRIGAIYHEADLQSAKILEGNQHKCNAFICRIYFGSRSWLDRCYSRFGAENYNTHLSPVE